MQEIEGGVTLKIVSEWYRDIWIPTNIEKDHIPERSECEAAGRKKFGGGVRVRDFVRKARSQEAPESWTRTGPKRIYRKTNIAE